MSSLIARWSGLAATFVAAAGCASTASSSAEIQVLGVGVVEKPAEVFTISGEISERADDPAPALAKASDKLRQIVDGLGELDGIESYALTSDDARTTIVRPRGCEIGERAYYGQDVRRPSDCSPIEAGAVITFSVRGEPAEAAGTVIAFFTDAGVENAILNGYDVTDRDAAQTEVKQAAMADALRTAQALADQAGVTLGRPSKIRYGREDRFNPPEQDLLTDERIVVTGYRTAVRQPSVDLELTPSPVRFNAEVAVTFGVAQDEAP